MKLNKVLIAPDSFKGSLTAMQAARAIEAGIKDIFPDCATVLLPVADGGEGTIDALVSATGGSYVTVTVSDPLMRPVRAVYGVADAGRTAVIEMAAASGLPLLSRFERNPMRTTTYGTGELIRDALARGCRRLLIGIGGSATNDGGTGMLQALGYRFLDREDRTLGTGGEILDRIAAVDTSRVMPELSEAECRVACDVANPFYGPEGAANVYAPQKGADAAMTRMLDEGLRNFADVVRAHCGCDVSLVPGAGAAGGVGGALLAFLGAELVPGARMVLNAIGFGDKIGGADLVITGEGKLDRQTLMGKAPQGVLEAAGTAGVPVIAIGGCVEDADLLLEAGFSGIFPITDGNPDFATALRADVATANIRRTAGRIARTFLQAHG